MEESDKSEYKVESRVIQNQLVMRAEHLKAQRNMDCVIPLIRNSRKDNIISSNRRRSWLPELRGRGTRKALGVIDMFHVHRFAQVSTFVRTQHSMHLKWVHFIACKLHFHKVD